jgi:hypothetical protein
VVHATSAGPPTATAPFGRRGRRPPSGRYGPRGGGPVTPQGPQGSGPPAGPATPSGPLAPLPNQRVHDAGIDDTIRWFHPVGGWSHDRLALAPPSSRSGQGGSGHPRPAVLEPPAGRPGPARASPARDPRLGGRRGGSPWRPGVPGVPGSGGQRHSGTLALLAAGGRTPGCAAGLVPPSASRSTSGPGAVRMRPPRPSEGAASGNGPIPAKRSSSRHVPIPALGRR